jgi:hypothetical protein
LTNWRLGEIITLRRKVKRDLRVIGFPKMKTSAQLLEPATLVTAAVLGLAIAAEDMATPFGDDTGQFTVFLWLLTSGLLGFAMPVRPWRWAAVIGPMLPIVYLGMKIAGRLPPDDPNGYGTYLILIAVSLVACLVGAYAGAGARRLLGRPWGAERDRSII